MNEKFLKPYDPQETEKRVYEKWAASGLFNPETSIAKGFTKPDAKPFTIVMPPPNVTGVLHMGHALMLTTQDIMIRFERMRGRRALWIPGTDHAAIATQSKVEKEISKKEGKSRHDLGREEMMKRIEAFAKESHDTIVSQVKVMGASCDWSREAYTLDETRNLAVRTMFRKMYDDGLIYRGHRIVNWDPKGQTTISDDEIVYETRKAKLYTFKYSKDFPITISTTRPETKIGDVAVAVNPEDSRYKQLVGKEYDLIFCGVPIHVKIIADENVQIDFGTGALGVTPAHSYVDAEMARKHNLPSDIQVIDERGKITLHGKRNPSCHISPTDEEFEWAKKLVEKKTTEARETVIEWLKKDGLLEKEEEIEQNVPTAERTGGIIEPLPKLQWFIDVNKEFVIPYADLTLHPIKSGAKTTLKEIMKKAVEDAAIRIIPIHFKDTYFHWINNLRDWCISRQIWFGHQIPAFYCYDCNIPNQIRVMREINEKYKSNFDIEKYEKDIHLDKTFEQFKSEVNNGRKSIPEYFVPIVEATEIKECPKCHGARLVKDPDTLDTWFSSGMWTFSVLGWPKKTKDLEIYHPTDILETGYEIIFHWVARMILMTGYALGTVPFRTVYLHGTVRDGQGRKMSKSLGNGIDPIDVAKKFGTDAGRMALIVGAAPGTDSKISEDKIKGYKNFANKLWNITRFILSNSEGISATDKSPLTEKDNGLLAEFDDLLRDVTKDMENFRFHLASEKLYHYVWHTLADVILEESKAILPDYKTGEIKDAAACLSRQITLLRILRDCLKALHPFMPFVTEEIWSLLPNAGEKMLLVESWPVLE